MKKEMLQAVDVKAFRVNRIMRQQEVDSFVQTQKIALEASKKVETLSTNLITAMNDNQRLRSENAGISTKLNVAREEIKKRDQEIARKNAEIARLKELASSSTRNNPEDPNGYFRALGLHPSFSTGLTKAEARKVIQSAYRVHSTIFHPDTGGSQERMKKINASRDALLAMYRG